MEGDREADFEMQEKMFQTGTMKKKKQMYQEADSDMMSGDDQLLYDEIMA